MAEYPHGPVIPALPPLPIDELLEPLAQVVRGGGQCVLRAPTGAGKTTRVPPALLERGAAGAGAVWLVEPRRLAARAAAARIAAERGARLGGEVGYHVRFDRRAGEATRILVLTEGLLVARLQQDPFLEGVGAVVFDEVHERHLEGDLALALVRRVRREARPDLGLVLASATVDAPHLAAALGDARVLECEGRLFPVEVRHRPARADARLEDSMAEAVREALLQSAGDVLCFLPGVGEIRRLAERLGGLARSASLELVELHGSLGPDDQDRALRAGPRRRVVLATNVAESSVTVEGIGAVVDSGLARRPRYDPAVGLDRLELGRISRASADQRAGRAGRLGPGLCLRLWSPLEERALAERDEPEIRRVDLSGAVLELLAFGEPEPAALEWLDAPEPARVDEARALLERLGALRHGSLTALGRDLARVPAPPRIARLLVEGARLGAPRRAALAAALLAERDPLRRAPRRAQDTARRAHSSFSDLLDRVHLVEDFEAHGRTRSEVGELEASGARFVLRARDEFARLAIETQRESGGASDSGEAILRAVLAAFPDRLARRRAPGSERALLAGGRGVVLSEESAVGEAELFCALELDAGRGEARCRLASGVERAWIPEEDLEARELVRFDEGAGRVVGLRQRTFNGLVLEEVSIPPPDAAQAEALLAEAAARDLPRLLEAADGELAELRARVAFARANLPELGLPELDQEFLRGLLPELCAGRRSLAELRAAPWAAAVEARLGPRAAHELAREVPERLEVPSGARHRVRYEPGAPPTLAARIQEFFGLSSTPRIARGRVPLRLELLAPSGRPQQVTSDLASFWRNTYPALRRELRPRYPRHDWPEDPLAAPPRRGPRPRREG